MLEAAHLRLVIEPIRGAAFEIDALVARVTDDNRHESIETGGPVGQECW